MKRTNFIRLWTINHFWWDIREMICIQLPQGENNMVWSSYVYFINFSLLTFIRTFDNKLNLISNSIWIYFWKVTFWVMYISSWSIFQKDFVCIPIKCAPMIFRSQSWNFRVSVCLMPESQDKSLKKCRNIELYFSALIILKNLPFQYKKYINKNNKKGMLFQ